jgi:hypothetical protein
MEPESSIPNSQTQTVCQQQHVKHEVIYSSNEIPLPIYDYIMCYGFNFIHWRKLRTLHEVRVSTKTDKGQIDRVDFRW